jgi:hypothetical protein
LGKIKNSGGSIGFIPFKMNFTMDGLSGIKIYNELNVDTSFLPQGYTNTTKFIVTGVDHKLNKNDWETIISTTLIPTTNNVSKITGSLKFSLQEEVLLETPVIPDDSKNPTTPLSTPILGTNLLIGDSIVPNFAKNKSQIGGEFSRPIKFFSFRSFTKKSGTQLCERFRTHAFCFSGECASGSSILFYLTQFWLWAFI